MTTPDRLIAELIAAAGGEIVGRIRLQKIFYLLEKAGIGSGLSFHYHHYGPYSAELDNALDRAQAVQGVKERIAHRQADGMPYSVFSLRNGRELGCGTLGQLPIEKARGLIAAMNARSSTVLELAATIHWLAEVERVPEWRKELLRRKGVKTERGRTEKAIELLEQLDLAPA
jgi:uncharacterized protein YwgA